MERNTIYTSNASLNKVKKKGTMHASTVIAIICTIFLKHVYCSVLDDLTSILENTPEDGRLQFPGLAEKYGYNCTAHNVTTEDGYILTMFHIQGNKSKPIFLQHGFLDSSDTFIIRGNVSLVAYLASKGYDIWLGNMRGNMYSRAHTTLDPDGLKFWEFSFHEIALYDVPAMIDYILDNTGQEKLPVIAHSEGTTLFYVVGSIMPEYSDKFTVVICYAPVAYIHNAEKPVFPMVSMTVGSVVSEVLTVFDHGELLRNSSILVSLIRDVCTVEAVGYALCAEGFASVVFGRDEDQLEPEFFKIAINHVPCGTSVKNFMHLQQLVDRREFAQYDYGVIKNLQIYKSSNPPQYELSKVNIKIALVVGLGDRLADYDDIQLLRQQLPEVVEYYEMSREEFNHVDFVWGRNNTELFEYTQSVLNQYG